MVWDKPTHSSMSYSMLIVAIRACKLFLLIEETMPPELEEVGRRIKQVKIKASTPGAEELNRRVPRSSRGRSALQGFLDKLRELCLIGKVEVKIEVGWES